MAETVQTSFKRYEKKYLLSVAQQKALLEGMMKYMKPDRFGKTTNCNVYYDTDDWELIRKSIEKPVYKEKLRVRSYGVPQTGEDVFIEIKKKYDGVVYKRRAAIASEYAGRYLAGDNRLAPDSQIGREIAWFQSRYRAKPKVYIAYDRTSFAGREDPELRITFDRNIRFRDYALDLRAGDFGTDMLPAGTVLMEIKIPGTAPLWLAQLLSELKIRPASFSKYGFYYKTYVLPKNMKEGNHSARIDHPVDHNDPVVPDLHGRICSARIA